LPSIGRDERNTLLQVLLIVMPVFLLIGAGYGGVRSGYLRPELSDYLNVYTVRIAMPCLLFQAMSKIDFGAAFNGYMLAAFYIGSFLSFIIAIALSRTIWRRRAGEAVSVGFTAMFSNTVMIGLPIVERAYGSAVLGPTFGIIAVNAPLLYLVGVTTMELSRRGGKPLSETLGTTLRTLLANPLMIGILAGLVFNLFEIALPGPIQEAVGMLAASAIPVALVGIGCTIARFRLKSEIAESLMVSALTLILHPLIAYVLAFQVFRLPPELVRAAVVLAATPAGANGYIFARLYDRAISLSASAILITTTLSIVTITIWLMILNAVLPGAAAP
jgi:malonate transporter and related proteins